MKELIPDMGVDQLFNPSEFTEKELLKLVYRELHTLRAEFDDYRKNNNTQRELSEMNKQIIALETEVAIGKRLQEEAESRSQRMVGYATVGVAIFSLILKFVV